MKNPHPLARNIKVIKVKDADEDTTTGLPRKLGWKLAITVLLMLQSMIVWFQLEVWRKLDKTTDSQLQQAKDIAWIKGKLGVASIQVVQPPVVGSVRQWHDPVP